MRDREPEEAFLAGVPDGSTSPVPRYLPRLLTPRPWSEGHTENPTKMTGFDALNTGTYCCGPLYENHLIFVYQSLSGLSKGGGVT